MGFFDVFRDTIFMKEDSDLEKQLLELKNIRLKLDNTDEIDKDIKQLEFGVNGEKEIAYELKNADIGMYVLHDVTYEYNGEKAQIDYLIFTRGYFYVVECKNLIGNVTIDNIGQFFRDYEYDGKYIREVIYSPYTQAVRHVDMMKKVWSTCHGKFDNFMWNGKLDEKSFFKPIVVLANSKSVLNKEEAPEEIKNNVIRSDQIVSYIKKDIESMNKSELCNDKFYKEAAEVWLSRSVLNDNSFVDKYKKIIEESNKKKIENELINFRKEKSFRMNIPAYYVFTDDELEELLKIMPKSVDELLIKQILPEIKVKCHGEEIIKILNS